MRTTVHNIYLLLLIVVIFTILIGGAYGFIIPTFFSDYKTYSILIIGIAVAALLAGYIGYQILANSTLLLKISIGISCAVAAAILVSFLALFIIINVRGS